MKIYPRQLKSLHGLQKEKKKLELQRQLLNEEDMFSLEGITGRLTGESNSWIDMLPISNPLVRTGIKLLRKRLFKRKESSTRRSAREEYADEAPKKNILLIVAKEVLGGYLKWKAIELSFKGIKSLMRKSRRDSYEDE